MYVTRQFPLAGCCSATVRVTGTKFSHRIGRVQPFVVSTFRGGASAVCACARAQVCPHRVNMGTVKHARAVQNRATATCSRANISRTGHRSDTGQTVLDSGEMDLANGVRFTVRHAPRAEWDPLILKILPFFGDISKIASAIAAVRHMTLR